MQSSKSRRKEERTERSLSRPPHRNHRNCFPKDGMYSGNEFTAAIPAHGLSLLRCHRRMSTLICVHKMEKMIFAIISLQGTLLSLIRYTMKKEHCLFLFLSPARKLNNSCDEYVDYIYAVMTAIRTTAAQIWQIFFDPDSEELLEYSSSLDEQRALDEEANGL